MPSFKVIAASFLALNAALVIYLYANLERISRLQPFIAGDLVASRHATATHVSDTKEPVSIVFFEFEAFDNGLAKSIYFSCLNLPLIPIYVVSKRTIYPPFKKERIPINCSVTFLTLESSLDKTYKAVRPELIIKSEYMIFLPGGSQIDSQDVNTLLARQDSASIGVISSSSIDEIRCLQISLSSKFWTLTYEKSETMTNCDFYLGDIAFIIPSQVLLTLNQPFKRPFAHSTFLQAKVLGLKILLHRQVLLKMFWSLNSELSERHRYHKALNLNSFYREFGIKKVLNFDNSTEWYGCSKGTLRCFGSVEHDMPEYLYEGKWTPPCCLRNLREIAKHVFKVLEHYGVRYWLEGGSLLGAVRSGDIIPWDYDIDIGVYREDLEKLSIFKTSLTSSVVDEFGFVWEKALEGDFFRVQYSQTNRLHVDIFPFYSRNGTMTKETWFEDHRQDMEFPEHFLKPLERMKFADFEPYGPNNPDKFLQLKFGEDYLTPKYPRPSLLNHKEAK